jgi:hypothetical protein
MDGLISTLQMVLLAQAEQQQTQVLPLDVMWQQITSLDLVEAVTFISFGAVWLISGWRVFKILVTICFGLLGLFLGLWANQQLIDGNGFWLGLICVVFFSILAVSFMRWGVSILGALSGGVLIAGGWIAIGLPQQYVWAGALIGLITGGVVSFLIFKIAVILFTSLGGSVLVAVGGMAMAYHSLVSEEQLKDLVFNCQWFLPTLVLVPMIGGILLQNKFSKGAPEWAE